MGEYDPIDSNADQTKKGWLTAILELGAWIGTLMSGFVAETISRKYGVLVAVTVFSIGVVIQATAQSGGHNVILGGRFVTGMGVGSLAAIVPIYNSEVAPPEVRGALVALQQLAITFGILISFWIDYGTNYIGGTELGKQKDAAWILPICLQLFPAAVLFFGMIFSMSPDELLLFFSLFPHPTMAPFRNFLHVMPHMPH
jgi:MFS family permease